MKKSRPRTARRAGKTRPKETRRLVVEFTNHHELLLRLGDAVNAVGVHLGTTAGAGRHGEAVAATEKTFIGYDEALKIILKCSGRTGPEDPVVDPIAPPSTRDQVVQCILKNVRDEGFSLPGPLSIGDTETCDALAGEVQYASN
jgi:hypothetical protein